ncbi:MAG: ammonium transporter [bacterium]
MSHVLAGRRIRRPLFMLFGATLAMLLFSTVGAQEPDGPSTADTLADLTTAIDTVWLLVTAFLVFWMQAGFALVEGGFTRAKNTGNILMKNMLDACVGGLLFWASGYAIAFGVSGDSSNGFMGDGNFFLSGGFEAYGSWMFQFAFAATAATIVSGAMAERTKFSAYLIYTAFISGLIYPFVVHWAWDVNGWLTAFRDDPFMANGYIDFAGSGVVHMVGGTAGLMGAIVVGARKGRFGPNKDPRVVTAHSLPLGVLGVFILWLGWYGFNPGSTLVVTGGFAAVAAKVAVTTTLAACAAAVTAVFFTKMKSGKYDIGIILNAVLGGLVGITAGCATVDPWAAVVIGMVAALIIPTASAVLEKLEIDDPVGAVPVHLVCGMWGVLAVGLFSTESGINVAYGEADGYGLLLGGGIEQFVAQVIGVAVIFAWTAALSGICFVAIKAIMGLRVSEAEEEEGLDIGEHGINAYDLTSITAPH